MNKKLLSLALVLVLLLSLVPVLTPTAQAGGTPSEIAANLAATFDEFYIDGVNVLNNKTSGSGSGGGTWAVSVYNVNSTSSVVRITLNNYVGKQINISSPETISAARMVTVEVNGTCRITGTNKSWHGIYNYNKLGKASLEVITNGSLEINNVSGGIVCGNDKANGQVSGEGYLDPHLSLRGAGSLNITASWCGISCYAGFHTETLGRMGQETIYGDLRISDTKVKITCTGNGYGLRSGGIWYMHMDEGAKWKGQGMSIGGGASVRVQMPDGNRALSYSSERPNGYKLDTGYVERGSYCGSFWWVGLPAAMNISAAQITITEPAAGAEPDYNPVFPVGSDYYSDTYNTNHFKNDVRWEDRVAGDILLVDESVFASGHSYAVIIYLTPENPCSFTSDATATVNGKPADVVNVRSSGQMYIEYIFPGWQKKDDTWYYYENGDFVTDWKKINNVWYYFNSSGEMLTDWQRIDGVWYYFRSSGAMVTGWQKINDAWYYFAPGGQMQTGWREINGTWYYLKPYGAMAASEWCGGWWLNADGSWTYPYKGSWHQNAKGWWFGDTSGWYARNASYRINDVVYTFDANGYMK